MRMTAPRQAARVSGVSIRYPAPLQPGDRIGVTAPSTGVPGTLQRRVDFCVAHLRERGYDVVVGDCMDGASATSAPAAERAAELMDLLLDPAVRAVVPPWGGELAIDLLPLLDFAAVAGAEPTWLVGYSDLTTLMLPLTLLTGVATLHGSNLMDTPYAAPEPLAHWLDAATLPRGASCDRAPRRRTSSTPGTTTSRIPTSARGRCGGLAAGRCWASPATVLASGRLLGGCLETVSMLTGSAYGDVPGFAAEQAPEGLLLYVEVAEADAFTAARMLHGLRLAGWFDAANAVLVGRPAGPGSPHFSQVDALAHAVGDLGVPVLYDLDIGHVPPQLAVVNGAPATVELTESTATLVQWLT
jgi:muramoyltetrapeptide carboxypeptidase LdcA involved in peptidoglycan recycling